MSESSDSDEFYDAEDSTPSRITKKQRLSKTPSRDAALPENADPEPAKPPEQKSDSPQNVDNQKFDTKPVQPKTVSDNTQKYNDGRKWFSDLRQRMQTEDDELGGLNASPPDSQTSSVEGVFAQPPPKTSHPFRIIEDDTESMKSTMSLGRVGRLLSGMEAGSNRDQLASISGSISNQSSSETTRDASPVSARSSQSATFAVPAEVPKKGTRSQEDVRTSQEPDVIASTKNSITIQNMKQGFDTSEAKSVDGIKVPIPPPRKRKKSGKQPSPTLSKKGSEDSESSSTKKTVMPLPSPASTIESLTRELEHSLDIHSAIKGQYVVKPQDEDKAKAEAPEDLETTEKVKSEDKSSKDKTHFGANNALNVPCNSNSIGRTSINSASGLSMSHFTGSGGGNAPAAGKGNVNVNNDANRKLGLSPKNSKERRRSAGDEQGVISQLNMLVRTRTDSGKQLSDLEILEQVTVLNLDTGERVPLSVAEDKLPQGINPLSLHIMRLTSEYVSSNTSLEKEKESDEESVDSKVSEIPPGKDTDRSSVRRKTEKIKKFFGSTMKKTMDKAKSIAQEVSHARHKEDIMDIVDEVTPGEQYIKLKASNSHKGPYDFDSLQHVQDLSGEHHGPVWCMKFSSCGRLLATAGQDKVLRVWVLKNAFQHFLDIRTKYNAEKVSPTPSQESLVSQHSSEDPTIAAALLEGTNNLSPFMPKPFCTYTGHTSDLLDVSWSKNYFVLSSSMDKTVRLWHISRKECLCCFQHIDFVTAIVFHPRDDRYFLSGSLDGKLRLWNIPDKKVAVWNEVDGQTKLITAANFCQNGKFAVVGSYDGRCIFYNTDRLKYHTTIHVRSTRGKNSTGRKISGIEPMPGEDKILITSNDSRIRLYDLRDLNLSCKYKGYVNVSSQIKASFSHDGKYIISGSENQCLYIWKTHHDYAKFSSVRRDRNDFWEGIKAHNAVVTCAVFAPNPDSIIREMEERELEQKGKNSDTASIEDPLVAQRTKGCGGYVLVSGDFNGCIKVFINKMKPKHSSLPASALA
ncbi:UNVERIFIED_CONTAM: hypothetical protein PYX00_003062 [Menopon gallinae]|uniref:WD repeat-containing protein 44 n=1 Tax=Menopon gallinae TaxID=328185 RepID=A0AAW2HZR8_9NEOP